MPYPNTPLDVLDLLATTPGKLDKRRLMQEHDSPELRKLLVYAVSPYINFGVQKLPEVGLATRNPAPEFDEFFELADRLAARTLTGNAAKNTLTEFFQRCSPQERLHFGGVLTKKLRCGVDTAINDVWPGTIPVFDPALAEDWFKSAEKANGKHVQFPKLQSMKLDGMRAIALHDGNLWRLYSREGRPIEGMPHILQDLAEYGNPHHVYDGELYSHEIVTQKGFPFLIGLLKRQDWDHTQMKGKEAEKVRTLVPWRDKVEYHIFDRVTKAGWDTQTNNETQYDRLMSLKVLVDEMRQAGATSLQYVKHFVVNNLEDAKARNAEFLMMGFEGSMLKDPKAPYKFGRGTQWLKYKLFQDGEFEVTGTYEGEGKWANSLGGFFVKTAGGQEFKCGGGRISMEDRNELWATREEHVGKMATIRYFELTPDEVPRFPIFHAFREGNE